MSANDVNAEMRDRANAWLPSSDYVPAVEAAKFAAHLEETDPEFLLAWLTTNAVAFLTDRISYWNRLERGSSVRREKPRAFAKASKDAANGDADGLGHFTVRYVVDKDNAVRTVAEMSGADHAFVAANYQSSGSRDLMLAAFHRAVAKTVGKKRTAEVMTEADYDAMLQSITQRMTAA